MEQYRFFSVHCSAKSSSRLASRWVDQDLRRRCRRYYRRSSHCRYSAPMLRWSMLACKAANGAYRCSLVQSGGSHHLRGVQNALSRRNRDAGPITPAYWPATSGQGRPTHRVLCFLRPRQSGTVRPCARPARRVSSSPIPRRLWQDSRFCHPGQRPDRYPATSLQHYEYETWECSPLFELLRLFESLRHTGYLHWGKVGGLKYSKSRPIDLQERQLLPSVVDNDAGGLSRPPRRSRSRRKQQEMSAN